MADSEKEVNLRMAHVYVPDSTSRAEQERLRELLQMMQAGVQQHNTYVKDFMQVLGPSALAFVTRTTLFHMRKY
jgi:hypothetical protein